MICYSHPDKLLLEHLTNVKNIGMQIFDSKNLNLDYSNSDIRKALEIMLSFHDFGKATSFFQSYLKFSIDNRHYKEKLELTYHALLSACYASYKTYNEVEDESSKLILSVIVFIAVRKHHGNLDDLDNLIVVSKLEWRNLEKQWNSIVLGKFKNDDIEFCDIKNFINELLWELDDVKRNIRFYFLVNLFFSILIYSDKTEVILGQSIQNRFSIKELDIIDKYKNIVYSATKKSELNLLRDDIYTISYQEMVQRLDSGNIFSINVPTGSGKTLTVINTALKIIKKDKSLSRIIYAIPFTSIIDQINEVLADVCSVNKCSFKNLIGVHHHLAEAEISIGENNFKGSKAQFIIENWDKPFVLTTFWQLFYSFISNKNSQLRKFHNLANSIIILDEVQTLPHKYWMLVREYIMKFVDVFNCKVIFLTATMPLIFQEEKNEIIPLIPLKYRNIFFSKFSRYIIQTINKLKNISIDDFFYLFKEKIKFELSKSFLFVFNTIKTSIIFFEMIKKTFPEREIIYLSTNILPIDREQRIKNIKNTSSKKIVISTQLIEAGVDISFDVVYRDFAPLDSIVQAAGRCNRNNNHIKGEVYIFSLKNEQGKNDYNYIYKGITLDTTRNLLLKYPKIIENELIDVINFYYKEIKDKISTTESVNMLENINNLSYDKLKDFKLIDEIPSFLVFFETDKVASKLLNKFKEIITYDDLFKRKEEFLSIKSQFYKYVLSLKLNNGTKNTFTSFKEFGTFRVIENDFVDSLYKKDIGFSEVIDEFF